jgi:hypothetical protein
LSVLPRGVLTIARELASFLGSKALQVHLIALYSDAVKSSSLPADSGNSNQHINRKRKAGEEESSFSSPVLKFLFQVMVFSSAKYQLTVRRR